MSSFFAGKKKKLTNKQTIEKEGPFHDGLAVGALSNGQRLLGGRGGRGSGDGSVVGDVVILGIVVLSVRRHLLERKKKSREKK